jgi:hypothetical protein
LHKVFATHQYEHELARTQFGRPYTMDILGPDDDLSEGECPIDHGKLRRRFPNALYCQVCTENLEDVPIDLTESSPERGRPLRNMQVQTSRLFVPVSIHPLKCWTSLKALE